MHMNKDQAMTIHFLAHSWITQDFIQEQMAEDIGPNLTTKEEGRLPDWQDVCHGSAFGHNENL